MAAERDELAPYLVKNLQKFDKSQSKYSSGSYGSVYLVTINGFPCIAKRLHNIFVERGVSAKQQSSITQRFRDECILMSRLRHPNIVQFMGVHYGKTPGELTLLMEGLYTDLEKCLATYSDIPRPIQLSILLDVAYGLLYLHSQMPPIIHRDIKASNVLLTKDMRAKLADLGVSKILDLHPLSEIARTVCPGTPGVMPPEALVEKPSYSTKLDNFSFGTLVLHVVNHEFPLPFETDTFQRGRKHIARRSSAIDKMGERHCLYPLTISCLRDDPKKRPTTAETCSVLEKLSKEYPRRYDNILDMYEKIHRVETEKEALGMKLSAEEEKCSKIELSLLAKEDDWGELMAKQTAETERLKKELEARTNEVQTCKEYLNSERQLRAEDEKNCIELESKLVEMRGELELMELDLDDHKERLTQAEKEAEAAKIHQVTDASTEEGISALQKAMSNAEHSRRSHYDKYMEEKNSREQAEQECIELRAANKELGIKLTALEAEMEVMRTQAIAWKEMMEGQGTDVTLKHKMERLVKENRGKIKAQRHEKTLVTLPSTDLPADTEHDKSQEQQPASTRAPAVHTSEEALSKSKAADTPKGPEGELPRKEEEGEFFVDGEEQTVPLFGGCSTCGHPLCEHSI